MRKFIRTETVVATINIKNAAGTLVDPGTSILVTITDSAGTDVVDGAAMTKTSTGIYYYNYTPGAATVLGYYIIKYVTIDGGLTTIKRDNFELVA
uniref:Uncharacterized protein n=1 Tax=viral metagenome TaxID=1070528 RepID=A0A6M3ITN5_9ZZZZ